MAKTLKIVIIGAGSAQFSLTMVKDLCLTENLRGSQVTFMDIDEQRLEAIYTLAKRYSAQLGADLAFEKTTDRALALQGADYVVNTGYVLGHVVEAHLRDLCSRNGYYHFGGGVGPYHQLWLMLSVAQDIERICPNAWLIQVGNPVFQGSTLMTRETSTKIIGLCHGHYGYLEIAETLGLDPAKVVWEAPGLNHNIWLTRFEYEGKDAYPLIDEWIASKGEEYWSGHRARSTHDAQMSRGACSQYRLYGRFPIGDTVRRGGWWYHSDIVTKKHWFGEPFGGPDTHIARPYFVKNLEKTIAQIMEAARDPQANLVEAFGASKSREQIVPIMDAISFNKGGSFQVNVPNRGGKLQGIPENVVVEVPARIDSSGLSIQEFNQLPPKILLNHVMPEWLDMERDLYAFKTGDKNMLLWQLLNEHQTRGYEQADVLLDELLNHPEIRAVEEFERFGEKEYISNYFQNM
ncbi:MAG: alpha-glucosidase/alpha-galactosidase [Anaerolineaceae bacterium]|nr:alpha-glucosidase/alpha-galactosidase [Anaerolineaceae bacterium]